MLTLYDAWCFWPDVMSRLRWLPWLPVDSEPLADCIKESILVAWKPIAYSRFGERMMRDAGLDPAYVPHGIDTEAFKPLNDKAGARQRLGLPEDKFLAVMVAANKGVPSRKSFPEIFDAWAQFTKGRSDCLLYLHTHPGPETLGMDLPHCAQKHGIDHDSIIFCDPYYNVLGYPTRYMCDLYNAADVLVNPAQGEGFGLPIVEAQACGCPVIVGDWTSMPELLFSGWAVHGQRIYTPQAVWQYVPAVEEILWAIEQAFDDRGRSGVVERAREGALEFNVDRVTEEYWRPLLADVESQIAEAGQYELETLDLSA